MTKEQINKNSGSTFRWKNSEIYYLNIAAAVIGIIYTWHTLWMPIMIIVAVIAAVALVLNATRMWSDNRWIRLLAAYGWIPADLVTLVYIIMYHGFYNNPFFIVIILLPCVCAPVWWIWKGDNWTVRIYSVYIFAMMAFWVALRFIHVPPGSILPAIYYGLILLAIVWMIAIAPKVFKRYEDVNAGVFLLCWLGLMMLDVILFQLIPYIADKTPIFTTIPWAR